MGLPKYPTYFHWRKALLSLFDYDCRSPIKVALLPATLHQPVDISEY